MGVDAEPIEPAYDSDRHRIPACACQPAPPRDCQVRLARRMAGIDMDHRCVRIIRMTFCEDRKVPCRPLPQHPKQQDIAGPCRVGRQGLEMRSDPVQQNFTAIRHGPVCGVWTNGNWFRTHDLAPDSPDQAEAIRTGTPAACLMAVRRSYPRPGCRDDPGTAITGIVSRHRGSPRPKDTTPRRHPRAYAENPGSSEDCRTSRGNSREFCCILR